jgi:hypothetical protein
LADASRLCRERQAGNHGVKKGATADERGLTRIMEKMMDDLLFPNPSESIRVHPWFISSYAGKSRFLQMKFHRQSSAANQDRWRT